MADPELVVVHDKKFKGNPAKELEESTFHPYRISIHDTKLNMQILANAEVNAKGVSEILKKFCGMNYSFRREFLHVLRNTGLAQHEPVPGHPKWTYSILAEKANLG